MAMLYKQVPFQIVDLYRTKVKKIILIIISAAMGFLQIKVLLNGRINVFIGRS
jgi:hypothetical protein